MLDTLVQNTSLAERLRRPHFADEGLPAIIVKAQEDAHCRLALAQLGYARVLTAYARHKREGKSTFEDLGRESLWPTVDFVGEWLKAERSRIVAHARMPFLMAMIVTIIAGLAFATVAALLG